MNASVIALVAFQALACGGLSANLASKKGYESGVWFAAGFFLGVFGLIAAAGLPVRLGAERDLAELRRAATQKQIDNAEKS